MSHSLTDMGKRLKQVLNDKHIKIVDFAAMAGFTNQIAHYYLRKKEIKRNTLERFCQLMGISVQEFLEWNGGVDRDGSLHHGQRFRSLISEKGISKTKLASLLQMTRRDAAGLADKALFSETEMDAVLKCLNISMDQFLHPLLVEDPGQSTRGQQFREKYYRLLEEHNELLKEVAKLKADNFRLLQGGDGVRT